MSTRARIGRRNADGSVTSIALHFDGGPAEVLPRLNADYTKGSAVDALLSGGDLLAMGRPAAGHPGAAVSDTVADYLNHARDGWTEHAYLLDGGCWWHRSMLAGGAANGG